MRNARFTKETKIRITAIGFVILLLIRMVTKIAFTGWTQLDPAEFRHEIIVHVLNIVTMVCLAFIAVRPERLAPLATLSFLYAALINFDSVTSNIMDLLMMFLGVESLRKMGIFKKHGRIRKIAIWTAYLLVRLYTLRFGFDEFLLGNTFHLGALGVVLFIKYIIELPTQTIVVEKPVYIELNEPLVLDLTQFPTFRDEDKNLIAKVLTGEKYDAIAREYNISTGTLKNKMHALLKEMHIADRTMLLAQYGGAQVLSTDEQRLKFLADREERRRKAIELYARDHNVDMNHSEQPK